MIDLHSHILPGIDDGAADLEDSLEMLTLAVDQGVKIQVLTPHIHVGRYTNDLDSIRTAFDAFHERARAQKLPIELRLAAEIRIGPEIVGLFNEGTNPLARELGGRARVSDGVSAQPGAERQHQSGALAPGARRQAHDRAPGA